MSEYLFSESRLFDFLSSRQKTMLAEIDSIAKDRFQNNSDAEIVDYIVANYAINAIGIDSEKIEVCASDTKIDVRHRFEYAAIDRGMPVYVAGTKFTIYIPYIGDKRIFDLSPSTFTHNPPLGVVNNNEIELTLSVTSNDRVKGEIDRNLNSINKYIAWTNSEISEYNSNLNSIALDRIQVRRNKLSADAETLRQLGFKIRMRKDSSKTHKLPTIQRKIIPRLRNSPENIEPALDMSEYENILKIIKNMVIVMERSPSAFSKIKEEQLRHHFLVQLNGQYEGQATGETFNFKGKTDIIVRHQNKNIFIAECKFWTGPKGLSAAIDQLLSYATWRDTKTAICLFYRGKNMSSIVAKIPNILIEHPNYLNKFEAIDETEFRCELGHKDDMSRKLILTVLVFHIPSGA